MSASVVDFDPDQLFVVDPRPEHIAFCRMMRRRALLIMDNMRTGAYIETKAIVSDEGRVILLVGICRDGAVWLLPDRSIEKHAKFVVSYLRRRLREYAERGIMLYATVDTSDPKAYRFAQAVFSPKG